MKICRIGTERGMLNAAIFSKNDQNPRSARICRLSTRSALAGRRPGGGVHCRQFRAGRGVLGYRRRSRERGRVRNRAAPRRPEEGEVAVDFDGRTITYGFGELDELVLAC